MKLIYLFLVVTPLFGQPPVTTQEERVKAAMQASIGRQRASVQKQVAMAVETSEPAFFVLQWPDPPQLAQTATADCDPLPSSEVRPLVEKAASREGLDAGLIHAVMRVESGFKPCATSSKGAQGLMQLMPATQLQFGVRDPYDPAESVAAGAKLLKQLVDRYQGDLQRALAAYNAGTAQVDRAGGLPEIPETTRYVKEILTPVSVH